MGMIRYTVDPKAEIALRFDDPDFLEALATADGDFADQLERLLAAKPAEADLSAFVADGVVIHARAGITGREDDKLGNASQQADARKGIKVDVPAANESLWGAWVVRVSDNDESVPQALSDRNRDRRQEAFGQLLAPVKDAMMARLVVHVRDVKRGALRDPAQTKARDGGKLLAPTFGSADGDAVGAGAGLG